MIDGHLELSLGLLEGVSITTCGIKFVHTFAMVDFRKKIAYNIILGRPFMRQIRLIQDWGNNHLYLRHKNATTRVSTSSHSYKDVHENPIQEYNSTIYHSRTPAWEQAKA